MPKAEIEFDAREFSAGAKRFSAAMVREVQLALARRTGPRWARTVRRLTPRRSGRLRGSVFHSVTGRRPIVLIVGYDRAELLRSQVGLPGAPRPYDEFVERGTRRRAGNRALPRARRIEDEQTRRDVQEALARASRRAFG